MKKLGMALAALVGFAVLIVVVAIIHNGPPMKEETYNIMVERAVKMAGDYGACAAAKANESWSEKKAWKLMDGTAKSDDPIVDEFLALIDQCHASDHITEETATKVTTIVAKYMVSTKRNNLNCVAFQIGKRWTEDGAKLFLEHDDSRIKQAVDWDTQCQNGTLAAK